MVNITLLGEQSVVDPVTERTLTLSARSVALLGLLISRTGSPQSRSAIAGAFWPDSSERQALTNLRRELHDLRQLVDDDSLEVTPTQLCWHDRGRHRVDLGIFLHEHAAAKAAGDDESAIRHGTAALQEYGGELLPGLDGDWLDEARARLRESCVELCDLVSAAAEHGNRLDVAEDAIRKRISLAPYDEPAYRRLMELQAGNGDRSGAVRTYHRLTELLEADLGLAPDPVTTRTLAGITAPDPPDAGPDGATGGRPGPAPAPLIDRLRGLDHRRTRLSALVTTLTVVAALAGGSAIQGRDPPGASAAVPANTVSELDGSGSVVASVQVGTNPIAVAADRDAVWVVNAGDDTVSKVNPATHAVTQTLDVGHDPRALVRTGDDLWVSNFADATVSRINVEAGRKVDTIEVGSDPDAIAAGPAGLWVANSGDNTIQRIDTATGTPGDPFDVGDGPDGLAVDDTSVWVANGREGSVMRIDARNGDQMTTPIRVGSGPRGIVRLGDDVWVADELSQSVTRITAATGHTHSIDVGDGPAAIAALEGSVWVADRYSGDLLRIDSDTEEQDRIAVHAPVHGLATAEGRLWVVSGALPSTSHHGGTLRVAATALPGHFSNIDIDPARAYDPWSVQPVRVVYDGLLADHYASADPQVLVPDLATSVPEPTDDGRTYTFNLRPGIRYSTGVRVKASDFVRGVHRALLATSGRPDFYAGIVGGRACIDHPASCDLSQGVVADDATGRVTFHLVGPDPQFLYKLTLLVVPTPPGTPLGRPASHLPGTGPYRIASYTHDQRVTLARNRFFRQWSAAAQPAGFVDGITWLKVAGAHEAADAVQQGRADLAALNAGEEEDPASVGSLIDGLRVSAPSRVHGSIPQATHFVVLNSSVPPFDNLLARQAFNYAIDRNQVVKLLGGPSRAVPTCQLMPPGMPSYQSYCPYTTGRPGGAYQGPDVARARNLVRASGTRGMKVTILDVVGDPYPPLDGYFAHVLRTLGYQATVRRLPNTPRNQAVFYTPRSRIQVESGWWGADFPLASNFYEIVSCAGDGATPVRHCDRDLDRRASGATTMMQTDPAAALRTWTDIDREVTDQAPLVPIANDLDTWITSERVGNFQAATGVIGPLLSQLWVR